MTVIKLLLAATLLLQLSACATHCARGNAGNIGHTPDDQSYGETLAAGQTRVNRHFQSVAASQAWNDCWSKLQGEGLVAMDFTYRKAKDSWTFEKIVVSKSNLPAGQDVAAQHCLEESLRSASFPVEMSNGPEKTAQEFLIRWTWPVPMPSTPEQMAARMIGGGHGGLGDIAGCSECVSRTEYPYGLKCEGRERGGHPDCRENATNVCSTSSSSCLLGAFGVAGGAIMF